MTIEIYQLTECIVICQKVLTPWWEVCLYVNNENGGQARQIIIEKRGGYKGCPHIVEINKTKQDLQIFVSKLL